MSYYIRSKHDGCSFLALPASPGGAVRWVALIEGIAPWTFATTRGAERARDMCAHDGEIVPADKPYTGKISTVQGDFTYNEARIAALISLPAF